MLGVCVAKARYTQCHVQFWVVLLSATSLLLWLGTKHALVMHKEYLLHTSNSTTRKSSLSKTSGTAGKKGTNYSESWEFFSSVRASIRLVAFSYGAGAVASLCGIGGGMLMGPIMLEMGLSPQISAATTATTLFMLSTTAS